MRFAAARNAHVEAGLACRDLDPGGTALLHFQRALELIETHEARVPRLSVSTPELLALTADAGEADRAKAMLAGMDEFLTKPIDAQRLLDIAERFTRRAVR